MTAVSARSLLMGTMPDVHPLIRATSLLVGQVLPGTTKDAGEQLQVIVRQTTERRTTPLPAGPTAGASGPAPSESRSADIGHGESAFKRFGSPEHAAAWAATPPIPKAIPFSLPLPANAALEDGASATSSSPASSYGLCPELAAINANAAAPERGSQTPPGMVRLIPESPPASD